MSTLMTERRRPLDNDDGQESLFGGDAFAAKAPTPTPWERQHTAPASTPSAVEPATTAPLDAAALEASVQAPLDEAQALTEPEQGPSTDDLAAYGLEVGTAPTEVPAHDAGEELAALERATVVPDGARPRAPLAGPTLDDLMSRAWEGLLTGLPAACPVCEGEVVPSFAGSPHGSCSSCGTTIE
jgi:hypothetical protein